MANEKDTASKNNENKELQIRSSTAEYLTYIASSGESGDTFEVRYEDENIWPTQKMMAELYGVTTSAINQHLNTVYNDMEITKEATIKKYLIVQN